MAYLSTLGQPQYATSTVPLATLLDPLELAAWRQRQSASARLPSAISADSDGGEFANAGYRLAMESPAPAFRTLAAISRPGFTPLPPVFVPGSPDNKRWTDLAARSLWDFLKSITPTYP